MARRSRRVGLIVLGALLACGLVRAEDFTPRLEYRYLGPGHLTLHVLDESGVHVETRTYVEDVVVVLGPPRRFGREVEENPVHLEIAPRSAVRNLAGQIGINSASTLSRVEQHWTLQVSGDRIEGTLTGVEEGTLSLIPDEANYLNSLRRTGFTGFEVEVIGYDTLAYGTTLSGSVGEQQVSLRLEGNVVSGDRAFAFEVTATRVDASGRPLPPADARPPEEPPPADGAAADAEAAPAAAGAGGADPFVGSFSGDGLQLTLALDGDGYIGELRFEDHQYPATAVTTDAGLEGTFESDGHAFAFEASFDGDTLVFVTAGARFALARDAPAPVNPLAPRNPLRR